MNVPLHHVADQLDKHPMHPGPARDALTLVAGVATGVLSGAFGIGGASLSTPAIRALGASAYLAVGTTLPSIFPGAAVGAARYGPEGLIETRAVRWCVPAGMVAAVAGSLASHAVPGHGHWLMIATACLIAFSAVRIGRSEPADAENVAGRPGQDDNGSDTASAGDRGREPTTPVSRWTLAAIGVGAGLLSGLLGVGGGIVLVPGFIEIAGIEIKRAVATSLVCVGLLALPSTVIHGALGDIDWRFAVLLIVGVLPGARVGATLAVRAGEGRFRVAVGSFLLVIAVIYATGEVAAVLKL